VRLPSLAEGIGVGTPKTRVLASPHDLAAAVAELRFPCWLKGEHHGALRATDLTTARCAQADLLATRNPAVLVQAHVEGPEVDVLAVGDGRGGSVGAVAMAKRVLDARGKAWAGITIRDARVDALVERFFRVTRWRGPCELELVVAKDGLQLIELNPRFPAWCYLSAGAGMNLPYAVVQLAFGRNVPHLSDYAVGTSFVRIALDQIVSLRNIESISMHGELWRTAESGP
jgi:carbamoyl-phosphate synthase large subunit